MRRTTRGKPASGKWGLPGAYLGEQRLQARPTDCSRHYLDGRRWRLLPTSHTGEPLPKPLRDLLHQREAGPCHLPLRVHRSRIVTVSMIKGAYSYGKAHDLVVLNEEVVRVSRGYTSTFIDALISERRVQRLA